MLANELVNSKQAININILIVLSVTCLIPYLFYKNYNSLPYYIVSITIH